MGSRLAADLQMRKRGRDAARDCPTHRPNWLDDRRARRVRPFTRAAREDPEGVLAEQAIARFRAKAADYARLFGFGGYAAREVNVSGSQPSAPMPYAAVRMSAAQAAEPLPGGGRQGNGRVTVQGSIQLK